MYHPSQMPWVADDGRIYSGARQQVVESDDADYVAWLASGQTPRPWPLDAAGEQTAAALQEILTPYGMWVDLVGYAADARWRKEVGGITVSGLPVATDDRSKQMLMGARVAANADPAFHTPWVGADGSIYPLDAPQIIALSNAVLAHVAACFATFAAIKIGIAAGTITTRAQVDAAFT